MNNKKVKKLIGCICASSLLLGAIPTNGIVASAADTTAEAGNGVTFSDTAGNKMEDAKYSLHGVSYDEKEGIFVRMDLENAAKIANTDSVYKDGEWALSVYSLAREASGGRIRFNTNSPTITIKAELYNWDATHVAQGGKMEAAKYGFDIYEDTADGSTYVDTVVAETKDEDGDGKIDPGSVYVNQTITLGDAQDRDITIYFPLIIETRNLEICVAEGSTVQEHKNDYEGNGRVVFYGNSITQGGSAVKPGSNYVNTTMRNLNMDFTNLGVWGSCKGQATFAEYIANLDDMSMLVMDYDGNESQASVFIQRHYPFYKIVREAHPDIPIVLLTRSGNRLQVNNAGDPDRYSTTAELKEVIRQTYERAKADGDENVHYVDGEVFFRYSYAYLPDGVHADAIGQQKMADALTIVLEEVLAGTKNLCIEPISCVDPSPVFAEDFSEIADETVRPTGLKVGNNAISDTGQEFYVTTQTDGNKAYQIEFVRAQGGGFVSLTPSTTIWDGEEHLAVELDAELHLIDDVIPLLGVKIGEDPNNKANQKYEVRVKVTEEEYIIYFYDGTNGTNPSDAAKTTKVKDQNFISMYAQGKVSFNLRITQTPVRRDGVDTFDIDVYVNDMLVAGYALSPQAGFEPNNFKIFCYGMGTNNESVNRAVVDNLKAYSLSAHTLSYVEVPDTTTDTGIKTFYECSKCDKKFLDDKGIVPATDNGYVFTKGCEKELFSDDFESGESKWGKYTTYYTGDETYGIVKEESGNHVYQMLVERASSNVSNYINVTDTILSGQSSYTIEMQGTLHQGGGAWPTISMRLRNSSSQGYEIQYQPTEEGHYVTLRDRTGAGATYQLKPVADEKLSEQMATGQVSYNLRVEVERIVIDETTQQVKFTVYNEELKLCEETITLVDPTIEVTRLFVYLYTGTKKDSTVYKATVDNVKVFYTDYHTITPVAATPSTDTVAGLKAHYGCDVCGKKYADAEGTEEVTAEQLAYAKLTDIICQTKTNVTNSQNEDIRFLVYVDDYTKYQSVTFKITCSAGTGTAICKDVYTGVYAGGQLYTTEDIFGVDGYFATFILKNNTPTDLEDTMTVVATWKALDGTETTKTRIVNISEERK